MNSFALCVFQNKSMGLLQEKGRFILLMELPVAVIIASCPGAVWSLLSVCCLFTCEIEIEIFLN